MRNPAPRTAHEGLIHTYKPMDGGPSQIPGASSEGRAHICIDTGRDSLHFTSLLHSFEPEEDRLGGVDGPDVLKRQRAAGEHGLGAAFDAGLCDGDAVPAALPRGRRRGGAHDGEGEEVQRVLLALQHAALHGEPPAPVQEAAAQLGPHRQVRHLARGQELDRTAPPPPTINISQRVVLKLPASPAGVKKDA